MAQRVNPPPMVAFPQNNPFPPGSREAAFVGTLINALNSQRIVIEQLWRRTGGGEDLVSDAEVQQFFNFESALQFSADETQTTTLNITSEESDRLSVKEVTGGVYTILPNQWIKAAQSPLLFFPTYPATNDRVRISNIDGKRVNFLGNGKTINGETDGVIRFKGRSIDFEYDGGEWRAV